jgi:CspA family cold shock protein
MNQGTVKWFNESKGFGFIQKDDGEEIFVHHTSIVADGYKTLTEGAKVEFQVEKTEKGPRAVSVVEL